MNSANRRSAPSALVTMSGRAKGGIHTRRVPECAWVGRCAAESGNAGASPGLAACIVSHRESGAKSRHGQRLSGPVVREARASQNRRARCWSSCRSGCLDSFQGPGALQPRTELAVLGRSERWVVVGVWAYSVHQPGAGLIGVPPPNGPSFTRAAPAPSCMVLSDASRGPHALLLRTCSGLLAAALAVSMRVPVCGRGLRPRSAGGCKFLQD